MKKAIFLSISLLCVFFIYPQAPVVEELKFEDYINNAHNSSGLRSSMLDFQGGIIYQRSIGFANLPYFNLNRVDTANHAYFEQALADLHIASSQVHFINYTTLRERVGADEEVENSVNIGIINARYDVLNYDETNPSNPYNAFTLEGTQLKYIDGKEPFTEVNSTVISPLKSNVTGSTILYKFRNDLIFSNGKPIKNLLADLGDGVDRTIITNGNLSLTQVSVTYTDPQRVYQKYRITFQDDSTLITRSSLFVDIPGAGTRSITGLPDTEDRNLTSDYGFRGMYDPQEIRGVLDYRIFYAGNNTAKKVSKPLIIIDGFDPGDNRKIEVKDYPDIEETKKYPPILKLMEYKDANEAEKNLVEDMTALGYDVIIVNFPSDRIRKTWLPNINSLPKEQRYVDGGADYIERNGLTVATLIKRINAELTTNGSTEKLVVVGPSMGGLISRYALAYLEKIGINHNTRLWVSFDSPHLGANIPLGLQTSLYFMKLSNIPGSADFYDYQLKSPAAQQMLIHQHQSYFMDMSYWSGKIIEQGFNADSGSPLYRSFYKNMYNNGLSGSHGYPKAYGIKNIALINGNPNVKIYGTGGENTVKVKGYGNLCFIWCSHPLVLKFETYNINSLQQT